MGAVFCPDKATGVTHGHETTLGTPAKPGEPQEQQEKVDNSSEVDEKQFSESVLCLVHVAANGYPKALRSTYAKRNELLRKHQGDMEAAAAEVKGKGHSLHTEVKDMLLGLIPYVGLPVSVLKPMWTELRRGCLIAAVYGHDLSKEETQARVLVTLGVAQGGERAKEKTLELAVKFFWAALCKKCGLSMAKKLPVGKLVSLLDFEEKAKKALIEEFRKDAQQLDESAYASVLDERPTNRDLVELLKEKGAMSIHQVKDQAASFLDLAKQKDLLKQKGASTLQQAQDKAEATLHQAQDKALGMLNSAKAKAGF